MTDALAALEPAERAEPAGPALKPPRAKPGAPPRAVERLVRIADPLAVADQVAGIWAESLHVEGDPVSKLRWFYQECPEGPGTLFTLVDRDGDSEQIVGVAGAGVRAFRAGGETLWGALMVDLSIVRSHRTLLPALRLVGQARAHVRERFDLAYGMPNRAAAGVFERQGYRLLGRMTRFVRVLRHAPYLGRVTSLPAVPAVGGALLDAASSLRRAPRRLASTRAGRLSWAEAFDERFDRLLAEAEPSYPLVGRRSASFLRWRFFGHPVGETSIATLVSQGSLRAYAVVQRDGDAAFIRDLFGHPDALGALLEQLSPVLRAGGAASVSLRFLGAPWMTELLLAQGFIPREATRAVCLDQGLSLAARGTAPLDKPERWFLTDADEDI